MADCERNEIFTSALMEIMIDWYYYDDDFHSPASIWYRADDGSVLASIGPYSVKYQLHARILMAISRGCYDGTGICQTYIQVGNDHCLPVIKHWWLAASVMISMRSSLVQGRCWGSGTAMMAGVPTLVHTLLQSLVIFMIMTIIIIFMTSTFSPPWDDRSISACCDE